MPEGLMEGVEEERKREGRAKETRGKGGEVATDAINRGASVRVAEAAAQAGVGQFIFASSCSVYGCAAGAPRTERDPVEPLTAYARSKIDTERALRQADLGEMMVTCLRFATACGFSDRLRLDLVLNDFVASALPTGEIAVLSDDTAWRPPTPFSRTAPRV